MKYRADIDGLRALAVLAVVFFHADVELFSGGFVGVDIFFVISGYLITGIIAGEIRSGQFSLLRFYERRIRRIFPALFTMIACTTVAATFLFMPAELKDYSQSLAAAALSLSNLLFWAESGYFDAPAELKPLLHTWSLAVEEQFYFLLPLLLLLGSRFLKGRVVGLCAATATLSLLVSVWQLRADPSAAFFLLPARAWELMLGALLALGLVQPVRHPVARELLAALGAALILWSVFVYNALTPFPGPAALLPCLGAALIIYAGSGGQTAVGRLLGTPPAVFIGLISYSLYLWHWPVIVFGKYYAIKPLEPVQMAVALALSFCLAVASWRFVERPFRHSALPAPQSARRAYAGAAALTVAAIAVGLVGHVRDGLPERLPAHVAAYAAGTEDINPARQRCHEQGLERATRGELCRVGPAGKRPSFIVWGDSLADALQPAFALQAERVGIAGWYVSHSGCPPLLGVARADRPRSHGCRKFNDAVMKVIERTDIDTVVLVGRWSGYNPGDENPRLYKPRSPLTDQLAAQDGQGSPDELFYRALRRTVARLREQQRHVWLVEQPPESKTNDPSVIARTVFVGKQPEHLWLASSEHERRQHLVNLTFDRLQRELGLRTLDPAQLLCATGACVNTRNGHSIYRDLDHVSTYGAALLEPLLQPIFARDPMGLAKSAAPEGTPTRRIPVEQATGRPATPSDLRSTEERQTEDAKVLPL
jgi:peptidoglycan/LPS O-acetylase OafA/YrhL